MAERRRTRSAEGDDDYASRLVDDAARLDDEPEDVDDEPELTGDDEGEAAQPASRARRAASGRRRSEGRRPAPRQHGTLSLKDAARAALEQITELTAKPAESITGVERTDDGWRVGIEVVEDRRIPSSADVLATYRADITADGELVSYRRTRTYPRGRGENGGGS